MGKSKVLGDNVMVENRVGKRAQLGQWHRRARAWKNMAVSASMRRIDEQWVPEPHAGHFIVTYKCNLKCKGCDSWKVAEHNDLSATEWREVFRQMPHLDLVKILGGEPMVRKDIVDILVAVREEVDPYILQLTTNGMLEQRLVDVIEAIAWPGLQLRISVDGLPETHDNMRGMMGSWSIVDSTVHRVAELKEKYGFSFGINFAVTDNSMEDLPKMRQYASSVGADLIPGLAVAPFLVGTRPPEVLTPRIIMISDEKKALDVMTHQEVGTKSQLPLLDHLYSRWITKKTFKKQLFEGAHAFHCRELQDLVFVTPNGDLVRCSLDHEPVGNFREQSFRDIWTSTKIEKARQKVKDCPGCLQASVQILSRLYGGCLLS